MKKSKGQNGELAEEEDRNTEFLLNNGVAMYATDTCPIDEVIYQFFYFKEKIANMKRNIALIGKPNSTKNLCDFLYNYHNNKKLLQ